MTAIRSRVLLVFAMIVPLGCSPDRTSERSSVSSLVRVVVTTPDGRPLPGAALEVSNERHFVDDQGAAEWRLARPEARAEGALLKVTCPSGYRSDEKPRRLAWLEAAANKAAAFRVHFVCKPQQVTLGLALFVETKDEARAWLSERFLGRTRNGVLHVTLAAFPGERLQLEVEPDDSRVHFGAAQRSIAVTDRNMLVVHGVQAHRRKEPRKRVLNPPRHLPEPILPQRL